MIDSDTRPIYLLGTFVRDATQEYRHRDAMTTSHTDTVQVTEVYAMPHKDEAEGHITVDVGFIVVGFTETAADQDQFVELLRAALQPDQGEFGDISVQDFLGGPSYITTGGWIGSQDLALRLYALLEHYELGKIILPRTLGITGDQERELMGGGFVMFSPTQKLSTALQD